MGKQLQYWCWIVQIQNSHNAYQQKIKHFIFHLDVLLISTHRISKSVVSSYWKLKDYEWHIILCFWIFLNMCDEWRAFIWLEETKPILRLRDRWTGTHTGELQVQVAYTHLFKSESIWMSFVPIVELLFVCALW